MVCPRVEPPTISHRPAGSAGRARRSARRGTARRGRCRIARPPSAAGPSRPTGSAPASRLVGEAELLEQPVGAPPPLAWPPCRSTDRGSTGSPNVEARSSVLVCVTTPMRCFAFAGGRRRRCRPRSWPARGDHAGREHADGGRLAGAVGSEQPEDLTAAHVRSSDSTAALRCAGSAATGLAPGGPAPGRANAGGPAYILRRERVRITVLMSAPADVTRTLYGVSRYIANLRAWQRRVKQRASDQRLAVEIEGMLRVPCGHRREHRLAASVPPTICDAITAMTMPAKASRRYCCQTHRRRRRRRIAASAGAVLVEQLALDLPPSSGSGPAPRK